MRLYAIAVYLFLYIPIAIIALDAELGADCPGQLLTVFAPGNLAQFALCGGNYRVIDRDLSGGERQRVVVQSKQAAAPGGQSWVRTRTPSK